MVISGEHKEMFTMFFFDLIYGINSFKIRWIIFYYDKFLNQFTADALGVEVLAGPQECTAIGNIMLQAKASGEVADIWAMRRIIANSVEMVPYHPTGDKAAWDQAYEKYINILKNKN